MNRNHTNILGVKISSLTYNSTLQKIEKWINTKKRDYICVAAVHLIMECQRNNKLLSGVNKAGLVTPDGMPLVWISKLKGQAQTRRVYGPTLTLKLCSLAEKNDYTVFLLGGARGQTKTMATKLKNKFTKIKVVGYHDTPIRPIPKKENQKIVRKINKSKAQIVFVGMGCPTQEQWMIDNRINLRANVLIGVGAAFDFITGEIRQAPFWIQKLGFEWLFRLTQDPLRLWRRYIIDNFKFLVKIFLHF